MSLQRKAPLRARPAQPAPPRERRLPPVPATPPVPRATMIWRPNGAVAPVPVTAPRPRARRPAATAAEREHMGKVAQLRCVLCRRLGLQQESKTDVHHVREDQGGAQRAPNWLVAALCHERCHQGPHGIHGDRSLLRQAKCTELDLLAWTLEALLTHH